MRTHDLENVISMHADNKYRMMEMRKTLNQIKATTKSQNRFNPRKSQKSSNSNRWRAAVAIGSNGEGNNVARKMGLVQ